MFKIGTFNIRGFVKKRRERKKHELLDGDIDSFLTFECCHQETKINKGFDIKYG